jgi:hypothetical protein
LGTFLDHTGLVAVARPRGDPALTPARAPTPKRGTAVVRGASR